MASIDPDPLSIPDKILQTLFSSLEGQEGFDEGIIFQLRALAEQNELTKIEEVSPGLKIDKGRNDDYH